MTGTETTGAGELLASVRAHFRSDDQIEYYARGSGRDVAPVERRLLEHVSANLEPGFRALDLGSGAGKIARALLDAGAGELTLVDLSEELLEAASRDLPSSARLVVAEMTSWDPAGREWDCVWFNKSLSYLHGKHRRVELLRRAARRLPAHGMVVVVEHVLPDDIDVDAETMFDDSLSAIQESGDNYLRGTLPYVHWYTAPELEQECSAAGLQVLFDVHGQGLAGYVLRGL